jgi:hypothetical protein
MPCGCTFKRRWLAYLFLLLRARKHGFFAARCWERLGRSGRASVPFSRQARCRTEIHTRQKALHICQRRIGLRSLCGQQVGVCRQPKTGLIDARMRRVMCWQMIVRADDASGGRPTQGQPEREPNWGCDVAGLEKKSMQKRNCFGSSSAACSRGGKVRWVERCHTCQTTHKVICETMVKMGLAGRTGR